MTTNVILLYCQILLPKRLKFKSNMMLYILVVHYVVNKHMMIALVTLYSKI